MYLLDVQYNGETGKAIKWFYDQKSLGLFFEPDDSGHLPYMLSSDTELEITHKGIKSTKKVMKYNARHCQLESFLKIEAGDPLSIGGRKSIRDLIPEKQAFESNILYRDCYTADMGLIPGYDNDTDHVLPPDIEKKIDSLDQEKIRINYIKHISTLLTQPVPDIPRIAIDIEIATPEDGTMPNIFKAEYQIISVAFSATDGYREFIDINDTNEIELIYKIFENINGKYPIVLTYNGDNFDLKYIMNRARRLGIEDNNIPISFDSSGECAHIERSIHVDLFKFFCRTFIQGYAFGKKYKTYSLEVVSQGLLGKGKIKVNPKDIHLLPRHELEKYNLRDTDLTLELTTFDSNIVMELLLMFMRLYKKGMYDASRDRLQSLTYQMVVWEHRQRNYVVPNKTILAEMGAGKSKAVIKGKKYKGAMVIKPKKGVHFNVKVIDFASLYPSVIKTMNLSYETINCMHKNCKKNIIPDSNGNWYCDKNVGLFSLIIGGIRDVRVYIFKPLRKNNTFYRTIEQALKVLINGSYGTFGAESFSLYSVPMAESTTAAARGSIMATMEKAKEMKIILLYGDTDSLYLYDTTSEQIIEIMNWSINTLGIELGLDNDFRFICLTDRKKNYVGIEKDNSIEVKGLSVKKSNTPLFIQKKFNEMKDLLVAIQTPDDLPDFKVKFKSLVKEAKRIIEQRIGNPKDFAYNITLRSSMGSYTKTTPQHVRAAKILITELGVRVRKGDVISYLKYIDKEVDPILVAENSNGRWKQMLDSNTYKKQVDSCFNQIAEAFDINLNGQRRLF